MKKDNFSRQTISGVDIKGYFSFNSAIFYTFILLILGCSSKNAVFAHLKAPNDEKLGLKALSLHVHISQKDKRDKKKLKNDLKDIDKKNVNEFNERGKNYQIVEKDKDGKSERPFTYQCCVYNDSEALKLLIKKGVLFDYERGDGKNLLHIAAMNGSQNIINAVLDKKAPKKYNFPSGLLQFDKDGYSPLHIAASQFKSDYICIAQKMIETMQNANIVSSKLVDGLFVTPLYLAAKNGATQMCRKIAILMKTDKKGKMKKGGIENLVVAYNKDNTKQIMAKDLSTIFGNSEIDESIFPHLILNKFYNIDVLKELGELGRGNFGAVKQLQISINGKKAIHCAAKELYSDFQDNDDKREMCEEIYAMINFCKSDKKNVVGKENVLAFYGMVPYEDKLLILTELASCSMEKYFDKLVKKNEAPDFKQLCKYVLDIAKGMNYIAAKGYVHRDLAERNVLIIGKPSKGRAVISDFGTARKCSLDKYYEAAYEQTASAELDPSYTAWEALHESKLVFNEKTDVWSFGLTVYSMMTFRKYKPLSLLWKLLAEENKSSPKAYAERINEDKEKGKKDPCEYLEGLEEIKSSQMKDLIKVCLSIEKNDRPKFKEIVDRLK